MTAAAEASDDTLLDDKGRPRDTALRRAAETALAYVHEAIKSAPDIGLDHLGGGNGPLNH